MKTLFSGLRLTWPKVLLLAVGAGVWAGLAASLPVLRDTSFQDISISFEWWIFFGIIIIMNSSSHWDAALKCFIFFLISQPLVYLIQIPFGASGAMLFQYYRYWLIWTLLTAPMGYIGYYMKNGGLPGLLILTPMLLLLGWHTFSFMREAVYFFPHHLLSMLFCIAAMFLYVNGIFTARRERLAGNVLCAVIVTVCIVMNLLPGPQSGRTYDTTLKYSDGELYFDDSFRVSLADERYGTVSIEKETIDGEEAYCIAASFTKTGKTTMLLENGEKSYVFELEIGRNTYDLRQLAPDGAPPE